MSDQKLSNRIVRSLSFWVTVGVLAIIWLGFTLPYWRPSYWSTYNKLAATKLAIEQRGEPVAFSDLDISDAAGYQIGDELASALAKLEDLPFELRQSLDSKEPLSTKDRGTLKKTLRANRRQMEAIASIENLNRCRVRYDFNTSCPADTILDIVQKTGELAYLWRAKVLLSLHASNDRQAVQGVLELCKTAEALRLDPFFVGQAVRIRIGNYAIDSLELVLAEATLEPSQHYEIDQAFARLEANFRLADSVRAESAAQFTMLENIGHPRVRELLQSIVSLGAGGESYSLSPPKTLLNRWASLSYQPNLMEQQAWLLEQMAMSAKLIDIPGAEASQRWTQLQQESSLELLKQANSPLFYMYPSVEAMRENAFTYRQRLNAARLALRVLRYYSQNDNLPKQLEEVLDEDLRSIPPNLSNGELPSYQVFNNNRFEIKYETAADTEHDDQSSISVELPTTTEIGTRE